MSDTQAVTTEDFAGLLTQSSQEQPETDSEALEQEQEPEAEHGPEESQDGEEPEGEAEEDGEAEEPEQPETDSESWTYKDDDGNDVEVTAEEAIEAHKNAKRLQADYTRKQQAFAKQREQELAAVQKQAAEQFQMVEQYQADVGEYQAAAARLNQLQGIDWNQAFDTDPVTAGKLQAEMVQLQGRMQSAGQRINQKRAQFQQGQAQALQQAQAAVWEHMGEKMPGFSKDTLKSMFSDAEKYGFSFEELNTIADKRLIHMWADLFQQAKRTAKLDESKPAIMKKVAKAPSKAKTAEVSAKPDVLKQQMNRLSQTKSLDDFARALIMTRSN